MRRSTWLVVMVGAIGTVWTPTVGLSQFKPEAAAPPSREAPERLRGKGALESLAPEGNALRIKTADGESWTLRLSPKTKIQVVGRAQLDYLAVKQDVQFAALVDKKRCRLHAPIQKLTIYSQSKEFSPGLFPDTSPEAADAVTALAREDFNTQWKPYFVAGRLTAVSDKSLVVAVPGLRDKLHCELAEQPILEIKFGDLSLVKPGDVIAMIKARKTAEHEAVLHEARIRLSAPLTAAERHRSPAPPKKPARVAPPGKSS